MSLLRLRATRALLTASNVLAITVASAWILFVVWVMLSGNGYDSTMAAMMFIVWGFMGFSILMSTSLLIGFGLSSFYKETSMRVARTVFIDLCLLAVFCVFTITSLTKTSNQAFVTKNLNKTEANQKADQIMSELPYTFKTFPPEAIIELASNHVPGSLVVPPEVLEKAIEAANLRNPDRERYSPANMKRKRFLDVATLLSPAIGWLATVFSVTIYWKRKNLVS